MGHEMSHIKNHDILISTVILAVVGTIALISEILFYSMFWGGAGRGRKNEGNIILLVIARRDTSLERAWSLLDT